MEKLNWERITCAAFILFAVTSIDLPAQNLTTLYSFCSQSDCTDGVYPQAELVQGTDGNFYGTTPSYSDSISSNGTVFRITSSGTLTTLYTFCFQDGCTDGYNPQAGLVQGSDGNFYGTTEDGGTYGDGTVFKISPSGVLTTLYAFCSLTDCTDGSVPVAVLVQGNDGSLYGTTEAGGANDHGTVFKITLSGALTTLYSFCSQSGCTDGAAPFVGLVQGSDGNFYGTTSEVSSDSGVISYGTVFKVTASGTLTTLYTFCSQSDCTDGYGPDAKLVQGNNGNFYGETRFGGAEGDGTVFEITPGGTLTTVYSFCSQSGCSDGSAPEDNGGLVQGTDGDFYGTTGEGGGSAGGGTVFRITPSGTLATLYTFCSQSGCTDGEYPVGGLVQGTNGSLYGTTNYGGAYDYGTVFSLVLEPAASLSPASINFGNQLVNTPSSPTNVTLSNTGYATLGITGITTSGPFAQSNNCGASLTEGSSCTITVTFTPTTTGAQSGTLTVTDNAPGSPQTVSLTGTGTAPVASVSPTSLTFANQAVGTSSSPQPVTLSNAGSAALTITAIATSGDFSQTNNCGSSVTVNSSCTINVTFTPTVAGTRTGALTINNNASGSPQTASLTGTGTAPGASVSPPSLTFGNQAVGTSSTSQPVMLSNSGSAALTITGITISGDFSQTNNCGSSVAASSSCTINVTFTPTATGTRTGTLTINDNATGSPQTVSLTGAGTAPGASVSPTSLTFGNQSVGTSSPSQPVALSNSGSAALTITGITISGDFSQTNNCGSSVAASSSCTINVTFTPTATGTRTGTLTINDNATGSPQTVSLTGAGTAPGASVSPTSLTFGNQSVGTSSPSQPVALSNSGSAALTITGITIGGDFSQTNNCGSSVAANSSCTLNVTFAPTVAGTRTGTLTINDNATGSPQTVSLTGAGTAPGASVSPTSLTFGNQSVGTSSPSQPVTLSNSGSAALAITGITTSGDFSKTNNCGSSLAASSSCIINVTFTPTATGTRTGTLTIDDNASGSPQTVSLTGTGTAVVLSGVALSGLPATITPGQQYNPTITLSSPPTGELTGTLSLQFQVDPKVANVTSADYFDPAMAFSGQSACTNNPCTMPVKITSATTMVGIQVGTVAGKFTLTLTQVIGADGTPYQLPSPLPHTGGTISASAPIITPGSNSVTITNVTSTGFEVVVSSASSSTRELVSATFDFQAASGTQLNGASPAPVPVDATSYFSSQKVGGSFGMTETFAFSGNTSALGCVTVTLTNSAGTSSPVNGCVQ